MAGLSSVEVERLRVAVESQAGAVQMGRRQLNEVVTQSENLAATWTGAAAAGFQGALANFNEQGQRLLTQLDNMQTMMIQTIHQFQQAHDQTVQQAVTVQSGMSEL